MKIFVSVKMVPDVSAPMLVKNGELIMDADRTILNAYDASAVEEALVLKEAHGGEVVVVSVGPAKAAETLRKAMAMGADSAVHITTENLEEEFLFDSYSYARILADYYKDQYYDALFFGKQSQDTDAGLTGSMVAEILDIPYVSNAINITREEDDKFVITRQTDNDQEIIKTSSSCLITCSNNMNEPRIPSLKGIITSKKKRLQKINLRDLHINERDYKPQIKLIEYKALPSRKAGEKLEDDADKAGKMLAEFLYQKNIFQ